jgi:hypothetical protein
LRKSQREIDYEVDENIKTASDFTILVRKISIDDDIINLKAELKHYFN